MGRSFAMLETGKSFLVPRCIQCYYSCPKLVSHFCVGSQDETLSIGSPEGHVPSCHAGLQHRSFLAPHASGLQLAPHLLTWPAKSWAVPALASISVQWEQSRRPKQLWCSGPDISTTCSSGGCLSSCLWFRAVQRTRQGLAPLCPQ